MAGNYLPFFGIIKIMDENKNSENVNSQRERGLLADKLFGKAYFQTARDHLDKAQVDLGRGATEQAAEHLKRVGMASAQALTHMTSARLSDAENEEWLRLQASKYSVVEDGMIMINFLDVSKEARIKFLSKKAFGQDEP